MSYRQFISSRNCNQSKVALRSNRIALDLPEFTQPSLQAEILNNSSSITNSRFSKIHLRTGNRSSASSLPLSIPQQWTQLQRSKFSMGKIIRIIHIWCNCPPRNRTQAARLMRITSLSWWVASLKTYVLKVTTCALSMKPRRQITQAVTKQVAGKAKWYACWLSSSRQLPIRRTMQAM